MKKLATNIIMAIAWIASASNCFAQQQSANSEFQGAEQGAGYLITKDIKVTRSKAANARFDRTIKAGRVALKSEENQYYFELIDCSEYFILGKDLITYYEPNQDTAPKRYAKRSVFNQSAKKVTIYKSAPNSWQAGKSVTLVPRVKEYIKKLTIKPVIIKDQKAVYICNNFTGSDKNTKQSMYGKKVYEITYYTNEGASSCYCYNGSQLMKYNLDSDGEFLDDFASTLKIDNNGYCFAKGYEEDSSFKPCSELSVVVGEYPGIGFLGWISPTQVVLDDIVYDVVK